MHFFPSDERYSTFFDFWVLDCSRATYAWECLPDPGDGNGPKLASLREIPLAAGSEATGELVTLHDSRLRAYDARGRAGWRRVTAKRIPSWPDDGPGLSYGALACADRSAFLYHPGARPSLRRICLASGATEALYRAADGVTSPRCTAPRLWPLADGALALWGGGGGDGSDPGQPGALSPPGIYTVSAPPLDCMWRWAAGAWSKLPNGGGGAPPPARAEAGLVPMGTVDGSALLIAGYSELLHTQMSTHEGASCAPASARLTRCLAVASYRYLNDVNLWTPDAGWRRVHLAGATLAPAAFRACCRLPDGRVLITGGYRGEVAVGGISFVRARRASRRRRRSRARRRG